MERVLETFDASWYGNALALAHRRLALDRCFPQVVLQRNSWRGTHHIAIFGEE